MPASRRSAVNIIARRHAAVPRRATRSTPTAPTTRRSARCSRASASRSNASRASAATSALASDFTPESYAERGGAQVGGDGPDHRRRRESGWRGRGDDPRGRGDDARGRRLRRLHGRRPARVVGRRERVRRLSGAGRRPALRRPDDPADPPADRLPRRCARRRAPCTRCSRAATAGTSTAARSAPGRRVVLPVAHDGGGLYFGDCKALMGDGEIVGPPEVGALVTASAEPRERPASMTWPRIETRRQHHDARLRQAPRVERTPGVPGAARTGSSRTTTSPSPKAALLMAMVAQARICQISNTDYTAYCTTPRDVWRAVRRD